MAAAQHGGGVRARREADQDALLRAPAGGNPVRFQVLEQLAVHHVGRQQQGQLAEFGEHARIRAVFVAPAVQQRFGRHIHHFDFVRLAQEGLRDAIGSTLPGEALHIELLLADVLEVDRRDDADAAIEQVFDILPALRIAAAGRIVVGQLVDQANARMAAEECRKVDHLVGLAAVPFLDRRDDLEAGKHSLDLLGVGRSAPARPRHPGRATCGGGPRRTCGRSCPRAKHNPGRL